MPTPRSLSGIKSKLLQPALTSHFEVEIPLPDNVQKNVLQKIGSKLSTDAQSQLNLLCCEATLPGSSLATIEINNDFTGVTERHAYRRIYDDRIDLTFYVDAQSYLPILFFESWIKYIAGESNAVDERMRGVSAAANNYFYRIRYPKTYICPQGLVVRKFERDYNKTLEYQFVNAFPISITSMPVSYEASNLLKCTVSMTYIRYLVTGPSGPVDPKPVDQIGSPDIQASINSSFTGIPDYFLNPQFGVSALPELSKSNITSQIRAVEIQNSLGMSDAGNSFLDSFDRTNSREVGRIGS